MDPDPDADLQHWKKDYFSLKERLLQIRFLQRAAHVCPQQSKTVAVG
jgi:hypothetical protein